MRATHSHDGHSLSESLHTLACRAWSQMVFITEMLPKFEESIVSPEGAPASQPRDAAADALGPKLL